MDQSALAVVEQFATEATEVLWSDAHTGRVQLQGPVRAETPEECEMTWETFRDLFNLEPKPIPPTLKVMNFFTIRTPDVQTAATVSPGDCPWIAYRIHNV